MNELAPFNKKQIEYINKSKTSWFNVAEGGKRGGKNVVNALAFCMALETHPDKIHLVAGVSLASAKINIIDCDGYGLLNYFEGRCREGLYKNKDCLYITTASGQQKVILIAGGSSNGDEKYIKGNSYGMAYVTEANECHPVFLKEVMDRTLSSSNRKIFHDLNPKPPSHWYYSEILDFHEQKQKEDSSYGYNYGHFNIFDNMSISNEQLSKVLATYDRNSIWYKRDILGNRIANAGILFPVIANNEDRFLVNKRTIEGGIITTGVDVGKNGSKHAFCTQAISRTYREIEVLRSDEIDCRNQDDVTGEMEGIGVKLKQLKDGFITHVKYVIICYGKIDRVFVDSAEPTIIDFLQQALIDEGLHIPVVGSIKIPINDRIHMIGILLMQNRIRFLKGETTEIVKGLQEVTQDDEEKDLDVWLDDGTSDIDILDAFDYGIEVWEKQLVRI